ncbi:MAG: exonuclease domain-containing protein [Bacteroidota bacterium]
MSKTYAIVDIETTGGKASRHRITEIAIVLHDGKQILDQWETLINPECHIPYGITELTGITQEMVQDAPKFYEVAKTIVEKTEKAVFVAHNVRFDYGFLREEFKRLGYTFSRRQLCTVRLSRKAFPGLRSYSLGKLIKHFGIQVEDRHRAMADTLATVELFEKILQQEEGEEQVKELVNLGIKESLLPKNVSLEDLHELPEACGVYYMHDKNGHLAYIGKSINIKKRVAEHFSKVTEKARKLQNCVHEISYEITGSELAALLLESHEIKAHRPYINRAQRRRFFPVVTYLYEDENGYTCFGVKKASAAERKKLQVVAEYPKLSHARGRLQRIIKRYELCARLCGIEKSHGNKVCFNYHIKKCHGACGQLESVEDYNERAAAALEDLKTIFEEDFLLIDEGRAADEKMVVWVQDGDYQGYGYIQTDIVADNLQGLKDCVNTRFESNPEVKRIIRRYTLDGSLQMIQL